MRYFFLLPTLFPLLCLSQNHDFFWTLGYGNQGNNDTTTLNGGVNIDFNFNPPLTYSTNRNIDFGVFCATCSDSLGSILYYTNGIRIYHNNNKLMENGDTINPGSVWNSSKNSGYPSPIGGLSVSFPGEKNKYILFHLGIKLENGGINLSPLYSTIIDMNKNSGEGMVIEKNKIIAQVNGNSLIWPSMVKHANGRDWWLITGEENSPTIQRFLITPEGIQGPFEQLTGLNFPAIERTSNCLFSPDGSYYARTDLNNGLNLFSFNRCTGELSNLQHIPEVPGYFICGNLLFSPDSKFLYNNRPDHIIQFDLSDGVLSFNKMDTIQHYDLFSDPTPPFGASYFFGQLGADNKLYLATGSSPSYMHVIHRPNLPAPLCDLENHGYDLPRYNASTVCYFPNYRLGAWEGSPCDTIQLQNPPPGFVNTQYEDFLEREARFKPQKQVPPPDVLERLRLSPPTKPDNEDPFDPANPKHITLRALAEKGVISQEEARRMMREQ
jgi:hypothetical protein